MLERADFAIARFSLDLLSPCRLEPYALLGLRRGLRQAARELPAAQIDRLFSPELSSDPVALRRFQKPAPPFVLRSGPWLHGVDLQEGDALELEVLFLGDGVRMIDDFALILRNFGNDGLAHGEGCFEIAGVTFRSAADGWHPCRPMPVKADSSCEVLSIGAWLDGLLPLPAPLSLEFVTPTRLVTNGRALRRPHFSQLLPFMLRRVTSMLYYHCDLEPVDDPAALLAMAGLVETTWDTASWIDWRELGEQGASRKVGGLTGRLHLSGEGADDWGWIVALATLFGIGRSAAYGAGQIRIYSDN